MNKKREKKRKKKGMGRGELQLRKQSLRTPLVDCTVVVFFTIQEPCPLLLLLETMTLSVKRREGGTEESPGKKTGHAFFVVIVLLVKGRSFFNN